jgi:hypothetical protein
MVKRYGSLRLVAICAQIVAWVALILGILLALAAVVVGAVQGRVGTPSPLLAPLPLLGSVVNLGRGLVAAVTVLAGAAVQFVLLCAAADFIHLNLDIEENTRQTMAFLQGEGELPPPPRPSAWNEPLSSSDD